MAETESLRNERPSLTRWHKIALGIFGVLFASILILGLLRIAYQGRFLPGATLYGVPVSGLTEASARDLVARETNQYIESSTIIVNGSEAQANKVSIPASEVELSYNIDSDLTSTYQYGRSGQIFEQLGSQLGLMLGFANLPEGSVSYNPAKLYAILQPVDASLSTSTVNASYAAANNQLSINPEKQGQRADWGRFLSDYEGLVLSRQRGAATVSAYTQPATVTQEILATKRSALAPFLEKPLVLTFEKKTWNVGSEALVSWLSYTSYAGPIQSDMLANYYGFERRDLSSVGFDTAKIKAYLQTIAPGVNRPAKDAVLTISGDRASVFQQSQDGRAIDLDVTAKAISDNLLAANPESTVPLTVVVTKADVNDENIERLGIKELLSEGVTYFPGSSANRIVNVKVGASKFNGVLLKPGQVFSFGEILGPVGPEQGYKEGRVILEGRQESQYGGGLCQVSSTAFRAALLAGLPITERYNHSFAVGYYTAPYGVPGIDATIYYPQVDFKFRNDTKNHILIQTEMVGTTLKFRFFGTKEKEGAIRGPNFIYGSNDPNQPSKTVFYRDIKVNGQVTKTDTFYTTYRSAADFPPVQ